MSGNPAMSPEAAGSTGRPMLLCWATAIGWGSWVLSLELLWGQQRMGVLHPHCLAFVILLVLTFASAILAAAYLSLSVLRRPRCRGSLSWGAAAIFPALAWLLLSLYAILQWRQNEVPNDVCWNTVAWASGSLMEAQALYLYPRRVETEHLVMFHDDRVATPRRDALAMDEHVARLAAILGVPLRAKIFWVRGRLLGMGPMACSGMAAGSARSPADWDTADHPQCLSVDRHELAHAVIQQWCKPDSDPPFLLVEGWAECQAGPSRANQAALALESRARWLARRGLSEATRQSYLSELLGPSWYHRIGAPVYDVGGALADFLRDYYGVERFLDLYVTCRPGTCAADFRRVLGEDLEMVESKFWREARRLVDGT
jgi:hypothetical protein